MTTPVVHIQNLTKTYRDTAVLNDVSLTLEPGRIYGLIGQNGAGKTTLMRIIAGLSYPDSGTLELFGCSGEKEIVNQRRRFGCIIESPSLVPHMTAKENLRLYRLMCGNPDETIEDTLLKQVGLENTGKKQVKDFSLGMRQRLGIAAALIGNPDVLILDEPINGLDPLGVVEIRNLLIRLCSEQKVTIFISSHNLPELYQTATDYIIIHNGIIRKTLSLAELETSCKHYLHISATCPEELMQTLETHLNAFDYRIQPDKSIKLYDYADEKEKVAHVLHENGVIVTGFTVCGDSLEDYFVSVVEGCQIA